MSRIVGFFIDGTHERGLKLALWLVAFVLLLAGASWVLAEQVASNMRAETHRSLAGYERQRANVLSTFMEMDRRLVQEPCSAAFLDEMRRIAFLPDGINELLYAPDGNVLCSVNSGKLADPVHLGEPDFIAGQAFGVVMWMDRDLSFLNLAGLVGTVAQRGALAVIVPQQELPHTAPRWLEQELVMRSSDGQWWHRQGEAGIYAQASKTSPSPLASVFSGAFYDIRCDEGGIHCIAARSSLSQLFSFGWATIGVILLVGAVLAAWASQQAHGLIQRYWSFEARFLRRLEQGSVVCAYQPLLCLRTGVASGCEVLARWRDVDGTIVPPDRFLPIIERHGLTERFTAMVVAYAFADLSANMPPATRLQVNFNIFPQDLDASRLVPLFAPFLKTNSPFEVVVELVETAEVQPETAQVEIERLRAAGLKVYIDDFGAGYSSMHNLAALSIDGVKLDRSFAMAPDHSVMSKMLDHAIELVQASGRSLVVEGVETQERLEALKATGRVDFAQGYGISRPLLIADFVAYMAKHGPRPSSRPRLVA